MKAAYIIHFKGHFVVAFAFSANDIRPSERSTVWCLKLRKVIRNTMRPKSRAYLKLPDDTCFNMSIPT